MQLTPTFIVVILAWAITLMGCAPSHPPPAQSEPSFPFSLRGRDTLLEFDFKAHPAVAISHKLKEDELCYMTVGDAVIMCTEDGSYLLFGPGDGVTLVRDNPLARLRLAGDDAVDQQWIDVFATVFLIAGSVDRLPDAVATYLADPGPHHSQATALARKMLSDNGASLPVAVRGNTFTVTLRLTESGRDTLTDALQSDAVQPGILKVGNNFYRHRDNP
jgi:hypothetical protein